VRCTSRAIVNADNFNVRNGMTNRTIRTIFGILFAPTAAPLIFAPIQASTVQHVGNTWLATFAAYFGFAAIVSYGISYTFGVAAILVLMKLRYDTPLAYGICGSVFGATYGLIACGVGSPGAIAVTAIFGVLGFAVSLSYSLIVGQKPISNQSTDPALSSGTPAAGQLPRLP
jgi:hypothetical protein